MIEAVILRWCFLLLLLLLLLGCFSVKDILWPMMAALSSCQQHHQHPIQHWVILEHFQSFFFLLHLPTSYATVAQSRLRAVPVQFQGAAHHRSEQHQSNISAVSQLFSACFGSSSSAVFEHIFIVYQWYFHRSQTIVSEQFQGSSRVISALF